DVMCRNFPGFASESFPKSLLNETLVEDPHSWRKCMVNRRIARGLKLFERTVRVNVSGLLAEIALRAIDDDPHVSVVITLGQTGRNLATGLPTRRRTVRSFPSLFRRLG